MSTCAWSSRSLGRPFPSMCRLFFGAEGSSKTSRLRYADPIYMWRNTHSVPTEHVKNGNGNEITAPAPAPPATRGRAHKHLSLGRTGWFLDGSIRAFHH